MKNVITRKQLTRNTFLVWGLFIMGALCIFSSCKKEKKDDLKQASGSFTAFEALINGQTLPLPTQTESIKINIDIVDNTHAKVTVVYYKNNQPQTAPPIDCTIGKDADGFIVLNDAANNQVVLYYDQSTIDFFAPGGGGNVSASKDGKKPDWWD